MPKNLDEFAAQVAAAPRKSPKSLFFRPRGRFSTLRDMHPVDACREARGD
jgi:hypothetical protein